MPKSSNNVLSNYSDNQSPKTTPTSDESHQALRNISKLSKQGQPRLQQNPNCIHPTLRELNLPPKTDKPSPLPSPTGACLASPPVFRLSVNASLPRLQHPSLSSIIRPSNNACQTAPKTHRASTATTLQGQRHPSYSSLQNQRFFCQDKVSGDSNVNSNHDMPDSFTIFNSNSKK